MQSGAPWPAVRRGSAPLRPRGWGATPSRPGGCGGLGGAGGGGAPWAARWWRGGRSVAAGTVGKLGGGVSSGEYMPILTIGARGVRHTR